MATRLSKNWEPIIKDNDISKHILNIVIDLEKSTGFKFYLFIYIIVLFIIVLLSCVRLRMELTNYASKPMDQKWLFCYLVVICSTDG